MRTSWFNIFIIFLFINYVPSSPYHFVDNANASLSDMRDTAFLREKRQINKYDPFVTTAFFVAVGLLMCPPPRIQNERKFCAINVKRLENNHALIIDPNDRSKFIYPNDDGSIILEERQPVFLSCPGIGNRLRNVVGHVHSQNFYCVCHEAFDADNTVYDFKDLVCESPPQYDVVDYGAYGRELEFRTFQIGFYTDLLPRWMELIHINYDRSVMSTMWVRSIISRSIAGSQKTAKNRRFDQKHCCEQSNFDMDIIYRTDVQDRAFAAQMMCHTSQVNKCPYFSESKGLIFNRGHLAPKSTFVYTSAGIATFVYLNTAPQWKPINDGNWARIEEHVIEIAKGLKRDLVVFTGVLGRLVLTDTADDNREKYIYLSHQHNMIAFPVPLYFWKLVIEPISNRGIVYVTVNNPYIENYENYQICNNPMTKLDEGKSPKQWKPKYIPRGFSYMCEVADFMMSNGINLGPFSTTYVNDLLYLKDGRGDPSTSGIHIDLK